MDEDPRQDTDHQPEEDLAGKRETVGVTNGVMWWVDLRAMILQWRPETAVYGLIVAP